VPPIPILVMVLGASAVVVALLGIMGEKPFLVRIAVTVGALALLLWAWTAITRGMRPF